jgi:hypothetical protein
MKITPIHVLLLAFAALVASRPLPSLAATDDACIHVCGSICVTQKFASMAKFNCDDKAKTACYKNFARCVKGGVKGCQWQESAELEACLQHLPDAK